MVNGNTSQWSLGIRNWDLGLGGCSQWSIVIGGYVLREVQTTHRLNQDLQDYALIPTSVSTHRMLVMDNEKPCR